MNAQLMSIGRWRGPVAALGLVIAIGYLALDIAPRIVAEVRLRKASELAANNPVRAIQTLEKSVPSSGLSNRQKERGIEVARDAMKALRGDRPLLRLIGQYVYDPATSSRQYLTAGREMILTFELPPKLKGLCPKIRVSNAGEDLCEVRFSEDGTTGRGEVPLGLGEAVVADVDLVCPVGVYGVVTAPIARSLHLVQRSGGPSLKMRAGERVVDLREGETVLLQVTRGTPLKVELTDDYGLNDLQWSLDGLAHDPFDWSEEADTGRREAPLPDDLTSQAANLRVLELKASNATATTRAMVALLVRDPAVSPIAHARIEKNPLVDGSKLHAGEKALTLVVTMSKGEAPPDLSVLWDEHPQKVHVNGQEASALLSAEFEGARSLIIQLKDVPLIRSTVNFDWTPPLVTAVMDPGPFARELEVRKAMHEAPIGSLVSVTIADATGLDRALIDWKADGLEEIIDPAPTASRPETSACVWTRRFRCVDAGEAFIRLSGSDLAGNRTTIHEYRIKTADPMEGRRLTLNGQPFPGTSPVYFKDTRFVVRTEGGIDVDGLAFFVLDPEQQNAVLGQAVLEREDQARSRIGHVDLTFIATSARRITGVLSRNERELVKGTIIIDFVKPVFRVMKLDDAGERDGVARFYAEPGSLVSLSVTDDVGVDITTISVQRGASMETVLGQNTEVGVVLQLPSVLDEPVVLKAADEAKNEAEYRFEVVARPQSDSRPADSNDSPSRPAPTPKATPDAGPPPPEKGPTLEELERTPKVMVQRLGTFLLVRMDPASSVPPFYIGEREVIVKEWRDFVTYLQGRGPADASQNDPQVTRGVTLATDAARLLNRNTAVLKKGEEEPLACVPAELVKAYVKWANDVAGDHGVWKVPTAVQWRLAAGRAAYPQALYPTTAAFPSGNDLTNEGAGGALFGRDPIAAAETPKRVWQPGAFGLRGMAGSLYEWVVDQNLRLRLIGGSVVSNKDACRLDAPLKSGLEVADFERGLRLVLLPRAR